MSTNDFRDFYIGVLTVLFQDYNMSTDEAEALFNKYKDLMIQEYDDGSGPVAAANMLATQDKREAHAPGTKWSDSICVELSDSGDPNDKWVKEYVGQPVWNFFDDVAETLPPKEAIQYIPERYRDAFKDYCAYYRLGYDFGHTEKNSGDAEKCDD